MKRFYVLIFFLMFSSAHATTYFVKNGGDDGAAGTSDATAWATINQVASANLNAGDDVFFKCGDSWTITSSYLTYLNIGWSGTSGNRSVFGAYYVDGTEILSADITTGAINGSFSTANTKPHIDGQGSTITQGYPAQTYLGAINISNKDYITVDYFNITNSGGKGIWITYSDYCDVSRCTVAGTYSGGINYNHGGNGSATYNDVSGWSRDWKYFGNGDWGIGLGGTRAEADNIILRYNTVHEGFGEGIGFYFGTENITVEYNKVYDARAVGIYLTCASHVDIGYNLVYWTGNELYIRGSGWIGMGMVVSDENDTNVSVYGSSHDIAWYNNMVAHTWQGWKFNTAVPTSHPSTFTVANNIFIGNYEQVSVGQLNCSRFDTVVFRNNAFWNYGGTSLDVGFTSTCSGELDWNYNAWSSSPGTYVTGANDYVGSLGLNKTTGWDSFGPETPATIYDFTPTESSNLKDAGVAVTGFNTRIQAGSVAPEGITVVSVFEDSGWEIGPTEVIGTAATVISNGAPSGTLATGTTSTNLTCNTNINKTLHYDTSDIAYGSMSGVFDTTGGTAHSEPISGLSNGNTYTYYVRADDSTSSYIITFSVDPGQTNLLNANTYVTGSDTNTYEDCHQLSNIWNGSTENGYLNCDATMGCAGCTTAIQEFDLGISYDLTDINVFGDNSNSWTCDTWSFKWKQNAVDEWTTAFTGASCNTEAYDEHSISITARYVRLEYFDALSLEVRNTVLYGSPSQGGGYPPAPSNRVGASYGGSGGVSGQYSANGVGN